ncbi:MAG: choice-of-anchor J domain-containing protein, partial [Bacteroidales bacterium]|nr:choice-of-anchor J domain-containing protein [Bacteroidales bacterium]
MKRTAWTLIMLLGVGLAMAGTSPKQAAGVSAPKADETFVTPPFVSNFDEPADFQDNWVATDRDGDGITWFYELHDNWPALDGTADEGGCLRAWYNREKAIDDWLIMSKPIRLSQGKAYIAFVYASAHRSPNEPERLAVYCGKNADPVELSKGNALDTWTFY